MRDFQLLIERAGLSARRALGKVNFLNSKFQRNYFQRDPEPVRPQTKKIGEDMIISYLVAANLRRTNRQVGGLTFGQTLSSRF